MKTIPLILSSFEEPGRQLTRVEVESNDPKNEKWLQDLLFLHPELISVDVFDESYGPAIPIGREVSTDRGPIDNLYVSPEGGITIVETKLWRNPEKHRTVVAQIIDYAKEVATWDFDDFRAAVLGASRKRNADKASLEELVTPVLSSIGVEQHEFQENLAERLSSGNFLLLIVGDRISPNIALLTQAIQSAPGLSFTIGLVEMQLYELNSGEDWPLVIVPEVVGRTVEKTRGVIQVRYTQEKPQIDVDVEDADEEDTSTTKLDLDLFLKEIPADLVEPYREGIEIWEKHGGRLHFSWKTMFFVMEIDGVERRFVRCRKGAVSTILQKHIEKWGLDPSLFDAYVDWLEESPVIHTNARNEKMWVKYTGISGADLRVLLQAGVQLMQLIRQSAA